MIAGRRRRRNLAAFGSDLPRSATPPTPSTPTVSAGGGRWRRLATSRHRVGGHLVKLRVRRVSLPHPVSRPPAPARRWSAPRPRTNTSTRPVQLAYELLHASRMYPGLHWCVGIFKIATGTETVIVSNDGASYIPPGVYLPRSARMLFADPELSAGFQAKWFGWVNPTATMVAYAAERSVLDPNIELYAVAATTDPGGSSVLPARRAGVPHYQDCDSTRSPFEPTAPPPELDESRLHRLAVMSPQTYEQLIDTDLPPTERHFGGMGGDRRCRRDSPRRRRAPPDRSGTRHPRNPRRARDAARRSQTNSGPPSPKCGCTASRCSCVPGSSRSSRPATRTPPLLYRAHHNLDRAVEALSLWRGDNPDYADIVYATEQVSKEEQLWPARTSS